MNIIILLLCNTLLWFSFFGNIFSIIIFFRSKFCGFMSCLMLAALSAINIGYVLVATPVHWYLTITYVFPSAETLAIHKFLLFSHPIAAMFQFAVSWLLVLITIEKYIEICHPFTYEKYCTRQIVVIVIGCNVLIAIAWNFVRFWEFDRIDEATGKYIPLLSYDSLFVVYRDVISVIARAIVPFVVLISLNILIFLRMKELENNGRHLTDYQKQTQEIAKIVRYIGIVFIICYGYPTILNIIKLIDKAWLYRHTAALVYDIYSMLMFANTLSVFALFFAISQPFRSELRSTVHFVAGRFDGSFTLPNVFKSPFKRQNGDGQANHSSFEPQNLAPEPIEEERI